MIILVDAGSPSASGFRTLNQIFVYPTLRLYKPLPEGGGQDGKRPFVRFEEERSASKIVKFLVRETGTRIAAKINFPPFLFRV